MNLPFEVEVLLGVFRAFRDSIHLVGGAVRNHVFKLPIKDYDLLLITKDEAKDVAELRILADRLSMSYNYFPKYGEDERWSVVKLVGIQEDPFDLTPPVVIDILITNQFSTVYKAVEAFPCNASMVFLDAQGIIIGLEQFDKFKGDKILRFNWADPTEQGGAMYDSHTHDYEARMRKYFPDSEVCHDL